MGMPRLKQRAIVRRTALPQRREFLAQPPHNPVIPPRGLTPEIRHHPRAFGGLTDTLERFVLSQAAQFGKAVALVLVVEQVAAENSDQIRLRDEW